jgi:hypothetical protein
VPTHAVYGVLVPCVDQKLHKDLIKTHKFKISVEKRNCISFMFATAKVLIIFYEDLQESV